jgi:hypothetical protein
MGLQGEAVLNNLPTLPDGSPNPNYNPKGFPGYVPPTPGMLSSLSGYGEAIGSDGSAQPTLDLQKLLSGGSLQAMGLDPANFPKFAGKWLGGGGQAADTLGVALQKSRDQAAKYALADLNTTAGVSGNLGGTVSGIGKIDLASRYAAQGAQDEASVAATREANLAGRMNQVLSGGGMILGNLSQERGQNIGGQESLIGSGLARNQQILDARRNQFGMETDLANRPMDYATGNYSSWLNRPQQMSDLDAILAGVGAGASGLNAYSQYLGAVA